MSPPAASVIVPMHNAAAHVLGQVAALANQSPRDVDFEVIWVDNGSNDQTLRLVADAVRDDPSHASRLRTRGAVVLLRSKPGR